MNRLQTMAVHPAKIDTIILDLRWRVGKVDPTTTDNLSIVQPYWADV